MGMAVATQLHTRGEPILSAARPKIDVSANKRDFRRDKTMAAHHQPADSTNRNAGDSPPPFRSIVELQAWLEAELLRLEHRFRGFSTRNSRRRDYEEKQRDSRCR